MLKIFKKTIKDKEMHETPSLEVGSWISVLNPTEEDIKYMTDVLGLDKKNITDVLDEYELPRIESDSKATYILIKAPVEGIDSITTIPVGIVLGDKYILTLAKRENKVIQTIMEKNSGLYTTQKINFMIHIFLFTSNLYEHYLKHLSKEISLKRAKLTDLSNKDIVNLIKYEDLLNEFISSFLPMVNLFEKILGGKYIPLYRQDKDLIEDLLINSRQTLDLCKSNIKTVINIREGYSTVLSNNLNKTIKLLTVFTILLSVPTTIASIYGMNIALPLQNSPHMFNYVILSILALMFALVYVFFRKKWL